jgi:hypothetical protein
MLRNCPETLSEAVSHSHIPGLVTAHVRKEETLPEVCHVYLSVRKMFKISFLGIPQLPLLQEPWARMESYVQAPAAREAGKEALQEVSPVHEEDE